ncbi:MAG: hypothetical protein QW035_01640 [Candidatus Anstonellales archaeon]
MAQESVVKKKEAAFQAFNILDAEEIRQQIILLEKSEKDKEVQKRLEELRKYHDTNSSLVSLLSFIDRQQSKEDIERVEKALSKNDPKEAEGELPTSIKWKEVKEPVKTIVRNKAIAQEILSKAGYKREAAVEQFIREASTINKAEIDKQLMSLESIDGFEGIVKELRAQPYIVRSAFLRFTAPTIIRNGGWTKKNAQMVEKVLKKLMEKKVSLFLLLDIFKRQAPSFFSFISDLRGFSSLLLGAALLSRIGGK